MPQTRPQTLIVGDFAVKDGGSVYSRSTEVIWFPKDLVSDWSH